MVETQATPAANDEVKKSDIEQLKAQATEQFKDKKFEDAIDSYVMALAGCDKYEERWMGKLPYKSDFGVLPELEQDCMFFQDFVRIKAVLNNNVAMCYFNLKKFDRADLYNNTALIEDPDYNEAIYWKCQILEKLGEFTDCVALLDWAIKKLQQDQEVKESKELIPQMQEIHQRCSRKIPQEQEFKAKLASEKKDSDTEGTDLSASEYDSEGDEQADRDEKDIFEDEDIKAMLADIMKESAALDDELKGVQPPQQM